MDYFLTKEDFYSQYPVTRFDNLIDSNDTFWQKALRSSIELVTGYLSTRWDTDFMFSPLLTFVLADAHLLNDRIFDNDIHYTCIQDAPINTPLADTDFFIVKDNRNPRIVEILIDIVLYNLSPRLNNADISEIIKERYDGNDPKQTGGAIGWLKMCVREKLSISSPLRAEGQTDQTGNAIIAINIVDAPDNKFTF